MKKILMKNDLDPLLKALFSRYLTYNKKRSICFLSIFINITFVPITHCDQESIKKLVCLHCGPMFVDTVQKVSIFKVDATISNSKRCFFSEAKIGTPVFQVRISTRDHTL